MSKFCWWCGEENRGPKIKASIDGNIVRVHSACKAAAEQSAKSLSAAPPDEYGSQWHTQHEQEE